MKRLPNDVSRCCGRLDGKVCPERDTCARYRTMELDKENPHAGHPKSYVAMFRSGPVCRYRIEVAA